MTREQVLINYIQEYLDIGLWQYEACDLNKDDLELIIKALAKQIDKEGDNTMNYNAFCWFLLSMMSDPYYCGESWVAYFKCKNTDGEIEEHYEVFSANLDFNYIEWFNDWYEGQDNIHVCGCYNIEGLVKGERRCSK